VYSGYTGGDKASFLGTESRGAKIISVKRAKHSAGKSLLGKDTDFRPERGGGRILEGGNSTQEGKGKGFLNGKKWGATTRR